MTRVRGLGSRFIWCVENRYVIEEAREYSGTRLQFVYDLQRNP